MKYSVPAPGGTFALYAQLRRQGTRAARGGVHDEAQRVTAPDWRQRFIESRRSQNVLRVLVVLGVGAIMGDGVLTPVSWQMQIQMQTAVDPVVVAVQWRGTTLCSCAALHAVVYIVLDMQHQVCEHAET
jgi:hypothetical protein